jgi:hypothetical protein
MSKAGMNLERKKDVAWYIFFPNVTYLIFP